MVTKELKPIYDYHKSFYKKAFVEEVEDYLNLYSYGTLVCSVIPCTNQLLIYEDKMWHSATTLRHIKEFVRQTIGYELSKDELREFLVSSDVRP